VYEEVRADRGAIDALIQETLRWESPVQFVSREPTEDVVIGGDAVPAGGLLSVVVGSANRDERHYQDPDRFMLHRKNDDHLAFGFGAHFCAGSHLARMELRVALEVWLERIPAFELADPGRVRWSGGQVRGPRLLPVRRSGD
jgi:cytochrome P450